MNEDLVMTVDDLTITKDSEGCILWAYPDPASPLAKALQKAGLWSDVLYKHRDIPTILLDQLKGDPWTIGYGHAKGDVKHGDVWTQIQADTMLLHDILDAEREVRKAVQFELTKDEFIALVDLAFNIGNANFDTSTLVKKLNAKDFDGAIAQFAVWNKAGGQVLQALVKRREAEAALFQLGTNYSA